MSSFPRTQASTALVGLALALPACRNAPSEPVDAPGAPVAPEVALQPPTEPARVSDAISATEDDDIDSLTLHVTNLSPATSEEQLWGPFDKIAPIEEANVYVDLDTGQSLGYGTVTFETAAGAEKALAAMNGAILDGVPIDVSPAAPKVP